MESTKEKWLDCFYCYREFEINEIFVAYMDNKGKIILSNCLDCGEKNSSQKPEKKGGWATIKRVLDGHYQLIPKQ